MRTPLDASRIELLTFDCYGTLIDWLGGVRMAVRMLESLVGCDFEQLVRDREELDHTEVVGAYERYGLKLGRSLELAAARQGRELSQSDRERFVASMATWPPFADTSASLRRLATRYRLAILSNVETRVLRSSIDLLDAPIEFFVTAEELGSYKPARAHWDEALRRSGVARERVLHVAQSLFHDVRPALALGFHVAWIDREREGRPADVEPDLVAGDLAELAERLRC